MLVATTIFHDEARLTILIILFSWDILFPIDDIEGNDFDFSLGFSIYTGSK